MKSKTVHKLVMALVIPVLCLAQIEKWVYVYDGSMNYEDIAHAIAYGLDGNIYAVGRTANPYRSSDFIVVSLYPTGDTNWMYVYDYNRLEDIAFCVEYGLDNNIYVGGMTSTAETCTDFTILSLTTDGGRNWVYRHDGAGTYDDYDIAHAITYGSDGNIYAGGTSKNAHSSAPDLFVVSLTPAGDTNWTYLHGDAEFSAGRVEAIAYGADGNIYVAGYCYDVTNSREFFVFSLSPAGDTNWTYQYDGGLGAYDEARSLVHGLDGNIYAAGFSSNYALSTSFTVISLTSEGEERWVYTYKGSDTANAANGIVYGSDNNLYVVGTCRWLDSADDMMVISLNTSGDTNWTYRLNGKDNDNDWGHAIAYGSDGNIYVAGAVNNALTEMDFTIVSLDPEGAENWVYSYDSPQLITRDEAYAIDFGMDDCIYAAGYTISSSGLWDFTVIGVESVTGIEETKTNLQPLVRLEVTPNPFTDLTQIRYMMQELRDSNFEMRKPMLNVYNAAGCLVKSFNLESGIVNRESVVCWDGTDATGKRLPGGVYFARFGSDESFAIEKILLIR